MFAACSNIRVVKLPESLRTIGYICFYDCISLVEVNIPSGVTELDEGTFFNCRALKKVILPDGIQHLPKQAFHGCKALVSIKLPLGIKTIGNAALSSCSSLSSVNFNELKELESVGSSAFARCALVKVDLLGLDKLMEIGDRAFDGCSALIDFTFPPNMTTVNFQVFFNCPNLAKVKLPASLQTNKKRRGRPRNDAAALLSLGKVKPPASPQTKRQRKLETQRKHLAG